MATTTNYGWDTPDDTDLVKDGAAAIRTLGSSIDTTTKNLNPQTTAGALAYRSATANVNTALPIGTAGQILAVSGGVPAWINNDQGDITEVQAGTGISVASGTGPIPVVTNTVATTFDAKGDLVVGTGADTFAKLTAGTNTYILTADSAEATGLKWAAPAGGGKVLQVVSTTYATQVQNFTTTYADTGLTLSITPSSATSKVLVLVSQNFWAGRNDVAVGVFARLMRGATEILPKWPVQLEATRVGSGPLVMGSEMGLSYLDSPATTSSTTYKTQFKLVYTDVGGWGTSANYQATSSIVLLEIGA